MSRETLRQSLTNIPKVGERELWVFCAGATTMLYINAFERLEKEGFGFSGYIDNFPEKSDGVYYGKKVLKLDELKDKKDNIFVLICTYYTNVINVVARQLSENGFDYCMLDEYILKTHSEKVLSVYDSLSDEKSKEIYERLILRRITGMKMELPVELTEQYFDIQGFTSNNPKEVFVDCGSYVGDTLEKFIWKCEGVFNKIIAFEPDEHNVLAMNYRIERLCNEWGLEKDKIYVYKKGLSDSNGKAGIYRSDISNGLGSYIQIDGEEGGNDIVTLDDFITEPYTFLKADIESWEYNMLKGAKKSIIKYKPKLAICIYHNAVDFYEIPLLVKEYIPDYNISIRHYSSTLCETVMYAWL